ncbi:MAG: ABC transporter permease [Bacteroidales bacterium]|jgi:putative ABC transport system permease protein|nr:ABC transporter permease [Bacteroidales bacterium]
MLKNYLILTFRNIFRQKAYSFINIFGLAVGITSFIIILLYVQNELSYNKHIEDAKNKYRVVEIQEAPGVGSQHVAVTMGPLAEALHNDFPEVEQSLRITRGGTQLVNYQDKSFNEQYICFADSNVFDMLSIELLHGDPQQALTQINAVVISEKIALKYFESIDRAMGKVLEIASEPFIVTGVMENITQNAHIYFEMVMPFSIMESRFSWMRSWGSNSLDTYIQLAEGANPADLEKKFPEFIEKYTSDYWDTKLEMYIQPLLDIHLKSNHIKFQVFNEKQGDINQVYIFSVIALLILIVASINYVNLSTARAVKRAKEVGIRKTAGAQKSRLIFQFLGESVIITFLAGLIAILLIELLLPSINQLLSLNLEMNFTNWSLSLGLPGLILILGILSGSYPAFYLSAFNPVKVLKGSAVNSSNRSSGGLRKILVVAQFVISIAIIISTLVAVAQVNFFHKKDKGYNDEAVYAISFHDQDDEQRVENMKLFKQELQGNPDIYSMALASGSTGVYGSQSKIYTADSSHTPIMVRFGAVDENYFEMMEISLVEGRYFSEDFSTDREEAIILNQSAVRELGWENPIGKEFDPRSEDSTAANIKVVGVIRDYNYFSLLSPIEPAAYFYNPSRYQQLIVKLNPEKIEPVIAFIEGKWNELYPKAPFDGFFMDEMFEYHYKNQINSMKVFGMFALICIVISCLGLYGLVAYMVTQRTKEIAIRKALGSSAGQVVRLINIDFIKLILVSSIIAVPVAFYYMTRWLNNFVYRIDLSWYYFAAAIAATIIIAVLTNIFHTVKAALKNPADSLRYE